MVNQKSNLVFLGTYLISACSVYFANSFLVQLNPLPPPPGHAPRAPRTAPGPTAAAALTVLAPPSQAPRGLPSWALHQ